MNEGSKNMYNGREVAKKDGFNVEGKREGMTVRIKKRNEGKEGRMEDLYSTSSLDK